MEFLHIPVLFNETIESLNIKPDGIYIDGTAGGAGHSSAIANKLTNGMLYSLDRDPDAVKVASQRLEGKRAKVIHANFADMKEVMQKENVSEVDGILLDLGVSSFQLDNAERGFSYHKAAPLDMRMSKSGVSAKDLVNKLSVNELCDIINRFGEEKFAYRIAQKIVDARGQAPINTTLELAEIISNAVPAKARRDGHPARKTFQALRIAVNGELDILNGAIESAFELLKSGGVLSIITFHSLEDRIVKQKFKELCTGCTCPPDFPVCVCGKKPKGKLLYKKGITAGETELKENQRARSATLRSIIKN